MRCNTSVQIDNIKVGPFTPIYNARIKNCRAANLSVPRNCFVNVTAQRELRTFTHSALVAKVLVAKANASANDACFGTVGGRVHQPNVIRIGLHLLAMPCNAPKCMAPEFECVAVNIYTVRFQIAHPLRLEQRRIGTRDAVVITRRKR